MLCNLAARRRFTTIFTLSIALVSFLNKLIKNDDCALMFFVSEKSSKACKY